MCLTTSITVMFWFKLLPLAAALVLGVSGLLLMSHLASTYSAMGEVILATSAMSKKKPMLSKADEERLTPAELYKVLLLQHDVAKQAQVPVNKQYRMDYQEHMRQHAGLVDLEQGDGAPSPKEEHGN